MNEEYTPFEEWFETFDRDGGELMLYNTIDLEAAYLAGAAAGYTEGAAAMREKCAEVAGLFDTSYDLVGDELMRRGDAALEVAAAIRKLEV